MSKKRSKIKNSRTTGQRRHINTTPLSRQAKAGQFEVLRILSGSINDKTLSIRDIFRTLEAQGFTKSAIDDAISRLLEKQLIVRNGKQKILISNKAPVYHGQISQHPRGFGFVKTTSNPGGIPPLSSDVFIPLQAMGNGHHGDTVAVLVTEKTSRNRYEGIVLQVLAQANPVIGGVVRQQGNDLLVLPDDNRFPFFITIDKKKNKAITGQAVIVEYDRNKLAGRFVPGKIVKILGSPDRVDVQVQLVITKFALNSRFSDTAQREADRLTMPAEVETARHDLRETAHITIDGEDAKDFDDAIHVKKTRNGYRLFVSIADVSYFVTAGSELDNGAYLRGTSIYFPGHVLPMLPEKLSNDLCSLVPDQDRLCVTAILDFDRAGKLQRKEFSRSIIRSRQRFTYRTVYAIGVGKDKELRKEYSMFTRQLKWAFELAEKLRANRLAGGSIDFNLAEPFFTINPAGEVAAIAPRERNSAHQLIEEFMLAANQAVASFLAEHAQSPVLYRIHETPDLVKLEPFLAFLKTLDLKLAPFTNKPGWFAELLAGCRGSKLEYIVNNLTLRLMQQARYSTSNLGHFGLAASHYTHFTSPIRRYPDLCIHRLLLATIARNTQDKTTAASVQKSAKDAEFLSLKEREAVNAERDMHDRLKALYMNRHVGETFAVIISQVTETTIFVELQEYCVSGLIEVSLLHDDYYIFDEKRYRLFGEISGRILQIGDQLTARLMEVDQISRRLYFRPVPSCMTAKEENLVGSV
jgi:ribonuclease R